MKKFMIVAVLTSLVALSGCNTVKGAGKDVQRAGEGIENSATKNK